MIGLSACLAALNCETFSTEFVLSVEFSIVANGYGNGTSGGLNTNAPGGIDLGTHLFVRVATTERIHRVPVVSLRASLTIISLEENSGAEHRRFVGTHYNRLEIIDLRKRSLNLPGLIHKFFGLKLLIQSVSRS